MYSAQGIFRHHFQCKKVRTILHKILYYLLTTNVNVICSDLVDQIIIIRLIGGLSPSSQTARSLLRPSRQGKRSLRRANIFAKSCKENAAVLHEVIKTLHFLRD